MWGKNVIQAAAMGDLGDVFEVCTVAANCQAGASNGALGGEMGGPQSVATDAAGNVYVADTGKERIQKFSSMGVWERAWGKDVVQTGGTGDTVGMLFEVCTVASECKIGVGESGKGGDFDVPQGVAADGSGNVYVASANGNRIQKFNSLGAWERAWGRDVIASGAMGDLGTVPEICTVAADCKTGSTGGVGGELTRPRGVATDSAGNVYAVESDGHRISRFSSTGVFERTWGRNVDNVAAGTGFEICTVAANCKVADASTGLGGEMNEPRAAATDAAGNVYVVERQGRRVQKFDSSGNFLATWGLDVIQLGMPGDLGMVFEVCTVAADCQQAPLSVMGLGGEFNSPSGIGSTASGVVYVADTGFNRIQKFEGEPVAPPPPGGGGSTPTVIPTTPAAAPPKKCKKGRKLKKGKCVKKKRKRRR